MPVFVKKYSEDQLTKAILMIIEQDIPLKKVAEITGINARTISRYKSNYTGSKESIKPPREKKKSTLPATIKTPEVAFNKDNTLPSAELQKQVEKTIIDRAKFLDDLFEVKQLVLDQIKDQIKKIKNIDALQKTLKTLNDIAKEVGPKGPGNLADNAKVVNMFNFFNQQLIDEGYEGPELTDADIVKND